MNGFDKNPVRLKLKDEVARGMNRQQYKEANSFLRLCCRQIHQAIDWDALNRHFCNQVIYGFSLENLEDTIKN